MLTVLTLTSIASMILQNSLFNTVCKKDLKTDSHVYRFNTIIYAVCILLFAIGLFNGHISLYTAGLGLLFGIVTALSNLYKMLALREGPMHITLLITTSSMIIPALSGIFFGETLSPAKLFIILILIGFIYLSLEKKGNQKTNSKWFILCILAFVFQGSIGILQKIHQTSAHKAELNGFLFISFICSLIYSRIRAKKSFKELGFNKKHLILAVIGGLCTYTMNILNLTQCYAHNPQVFPQAFVCKTTESSKFC